MSIPQSTRDIIESVLQRVPTSASASTSEPVEAPLEPAFRSVKWQPAGGVKPTMLKDLEDGHLRNIIFFLQRRDGYSQGVAKGISIMKNGMEGQDIWEAVLSEAQYRNLSWK